MAKLKPAEVWAVAKSEPIFRWAALIVGVISLIWIGIHVPPQVRGYVRSIDLRPIPNRTAVYRLEDGHCISFASLPEGWKPDRGSILGSSPGGPGSGVVVWKDVEGIPFGSIMTFSDGRRLNAEWVTDRRWAEIDAPPYQAWLGDDGATIFLNGDKANYTRYIWCSVPQYASRKRRVVTCSLYEDQTDPPGLSFDISFPLHQIGKADAVIAEGKAVLRKLEHSCDGAVAPPN